MVAAIADPQRRPRRAARGADRGRALTVLFTFITERTRYGRHIFAVGGNDEAARRAGISVTRIKLSVFTLASTLAAAGGILAASRLLAVNQQSGSGDVLLLAIAGPVIAGTSLFGGRGYVWSALLGAVVIGSISNGMDLLALDSDVKFMITGAVLLRRGDDRRGHQPPPGGYRLTGGAPLRFAVGVPNVREYGDPLLLLELGRAAEDAGWDGFFVWDHLAYSDPGAPVADPWMTIATIAASTERVRARRDGLHPRPAATAEGRPRDRLARRALRRAAGVRRRARLAVEGGVRQLQ